MDSSASLTVATFMDIAGDADTTGWIVDIDVPDGTPSATRWVQPAEPPDELVPITVAFAGDRVDVILSANVPDGFTILDAWCIDFAAPGEGPDGDERPRQGTLQGATLAFEIGHGQRLACTFQGRPTDLPPATIQIEQWLDPDGNLETMDGGPAGSGWAFGLEAHGGALRDPLVLTGSDGTATTKVRVDGAFATVRIVQLADRGAPFVTNACWDVRSEDDIEGTGDGPATVIEVAPDVLYRCRFTNEGRP